MKTGRRVERSRDLERFLTFIDASVAIAMTLLVLPLVDLTADLSSGNGAVSRLLDEHFDQLLAFFLSFAVIARAWWSHHEIVRDVIASSAAVARLTFLWLFTIVFLPFPTALAADAGEEAATKVLYVGTMTVSFGCLTALAWFVARDGSVRDPQSDSVPDALSLLSTTLCFVVALVVMLALPAQGYYPLLLLFLAAPLRRLWARGARGR